MNEPLVFLNGRLLPASQAHLAVWDAGVVQGATVAEVTRTFRKRPFRLGDHLDRLFRALRVAGLEIDLSPEQLADVSHQLLSHNGALLDDGAELGLVHFVTAGEYGVYAAGRPPREGPTVCAHTFPLSFARWAPRMRDGLHLVTPSVRQVPPACWDPRIKCRSRMHYYLADREARAADPEAAALLLDLEGRITETSTGNFLMVRGGEIVSPRADYTLPGVSRATVLELAAGLGIPFAERDIPPSLARAADEAFLSGTSYCLLPVTRLDGAPVGDGRPGPVFRRLLAAWSARVGVDIERQIRGGISSPAGR